ncbi:MAG: hypothetical protein L0J59_09740 [Lactococcus lactis]|nr:hypothetical protein [Lactococcus lactis]
MEIQRDFTIDSKLLKTFKKMSKEASKTYKQTIKEAIDLWIQKQKEWEM